MERSTVNVVSALPKTVVLVSSWLPTLTVRLAENVVLPLYSISLLTKTCVNVNKFLLH